MEKETTADEGNKLGMRIKKCLEMRRLSMIELDRLAEVPEHTTRKICAGYRQTTSFETGCKIALALGIPPEHLAGLSDRDELCHLDVAPTARAPRWHRMDGDYMKGAIENGDSIFIDFGINEVTTPGLYLAKLDGSEVIRRMAVKADKLLLTVSNQEYSLLNDERDLCDIIILGKVIGKYEKI